MNPAQPPSEQLPDAHCFLADLAWPDADGCAPGRVLAVPVGATEQHGPHLPLCTDTAIAVGLADGLSRARPGVVVAPR